MRSGTTSLRSAALPVSAVVIVAGLCATLAHAAATYSWGFDASGNWSDSTATTGWNASGAHPNAIGDVANLSLNITSGRTVSINVNDAKVGTLSMNDTGSSGDVAWTIDTTDASANKLAFDVSSGNASLTSAGATNSISAPIVLNDAIDITTTNGLSLGGAISGTSMALNKSGAGTLTLTGADANTYSGLTTVSAGTLSLDKASGKNAIGGDLTISGGTVTPNNTNSDQIADAATVTISGGTWSFNPSVGGNANQSETIANLNISSGSLNMNQLSSGTITVNTATSLSGGSINVTTGNSNTLNLKALSMSGGTINHTAFNNTGTLTVNATSLSITNTATDAYTPLTLRTNSDKRGTLNLSGDLTFAGNTTNANPVIINSVITSGSNIARLVLTLTGSTAEFNIGDGAADNDLVIRPEISGTNKGINKTGDGTLVLEAPNIYTGTTTVSAGRLRVNGSLSTSSTALVNVNRGTLDGIGAVNRPVTVGDGVLLSGDRDAFLAPGNSIGPLTVASAAFGVDGRLNIELQDLGAATNDGTTDLLTVTGVLNLTNAAVNFSLNGTANDTAYVFATYGSLSGGSFASVSGVPSGYKIDYQYNTLNQIALVPVPEPGSVALLGICSQGLLRRRRRL